MEGVYKTPNLKNIKRIEHFVKHKLGVPNLDWQELASEDGILYHLTCYYNKKRKGS
jgi:hypothetical protein